jgi:hypothetical protein
LAAYNYALQFYLALLPQKARKNFTKLTADSMFTARRDLIAGLVQSGQTNRNYIAAAYVRVHDLYVQLREMREASELSKNV